MRLALQAIPDSRRATYYSHINGHKHEPNSQKHVMRTLEIGADTVAVELTEFELMALAALVERSQEDVEITESDSSCIGLAINRVATEFRSLLGHFALACADTEE
jgi:hypothetical protein